MSAPTFPLRVPDSAYTLHHIASQTTIFTAVVSSDSVRPKDCVPPSRSCNLSAVVAFRSVKPFLFHRPRAECTISRCPISAIFLRSVGMRFSRFMLSLVASRAPLGASAVRPEPFGVILMSRPVGGFAFAFRFISLSTSILYTKRDTLSIL